MLLNNKKYIIIASILIITAIIASFFIGNSRNKIPPTINAVPEKVSIIFETEDLPYFLSSIHNNANLFSIISKSNLIKNTYNELKFIDSLFQSNNKLRYFFENKDVIISSHIINKTENSTLLIAPFQSKDKQNVKKIINDFKGEKLTLETIKYDKAEITTVSFEKKPDKKIFLSFYDGYFIISYSKILIQNSIRRINSNYSLSQNKNFNELYGYTKSNGKAKLFINYEYFLKSSSRIFNKSANKKFNFLHYFADWSGFDINISNQKIELSGYTVSKDNAQYLNLFKNLEPQKSQLLDIFPKKTSSFFTINIKNGNYFNSMFETYLSETKKLKKHKEQVYYHNKSFNFKSKQYQFYNYIGNEIGVCTEDVNKNGLNHNSYLFIKITDKEFYKNYVDSMNSRFCRKNKLIPKKFIKNITINDNKYTITKIHNNKMPEVFFGDFFKFIKSEYSAIIDNYLVFSESQHSIKDLIISYEKEQSFKAQSSDFNLVNSFSDESNILFYTNIFHSTGIINKYLSKKNSKKFLLDKKTNSYINGPVVQFIADSYPIYTTVSFEFDNSPPDISETVWETKLDTSLQIVPYITINHNTNEKEIFVQDKDNKIYLIDKNGTILWERHIPEAIISDVYQIDFYKNNKLQIIFNTKNEIYAYDRNGNYLENYPIKLKSPATNGISVIDYDFDKEYRIFIATQNKKIYLYDVKGKILNGWQFNKTQFNVTGKIKHFKNDKKDYIVFTDFHKLYILDRKGNTRVKPIADFPIGKNSEIFFERREGKNKSRFVTTNPEGTVYFIYPEDGSIKKMSIEKYSNLHYFNFTDINGDDIPEFIYTDKSQTDAYNSQKKRLFSYTYLSKITLKPQIYKFSKDNIKIGAWSDNNKIYLINNDGTIFDGFPLQGIGNFRISKFSEKPDFSLIVGGKSNFLYKYRVF